MKTFSSLTEQELTALSEDDISRYIDYACAENGVALLPTLPPEPATVLYEPDAKVYSVGYHLKFATLEEATRVMDAINANNPIETGYISTPSSIPSTVVTTRRQGGNTVAVEAAFSEARAAELRRELEGAKRAEDIYAKAKKEYDAAVSERNCYTEEIREAVEVAWSMKHKRDSLQRDYERYLNLADGNRHIAVKFLRNAHPDAAVLLPDLFVFEAEAERAAASA